MSADALPLTLLIIFAEFTIGGLWVLWLAGPRGAAAPAGADRGRPRLRRRAAGDRPALAGVRPADVGLRRHTPQPHRRRPGARRRVDGDDPGSLVPGDAPPAGAAAAGDDVLPPTGAGVPGAAPDA